MADGVKLFKESESNNEEEKISPLSYNYQLTDGSVLDDSVMLDNEVDSQPPQNLSQKLSSSAVEQLSNVCPGEGHPPKELTEVSNFCYDRSTHVKRTRGRPRKDCQRPTKHHLGQSMATKVYVLYRIILFSF